jgi:2-amino-4-hydroxy-6-hydroxymethyldihydropteridine diphosphokinase
MKSALRTPHSALAFVSLGSNLGDSKAIVLDAIGWLEGLSDEPVLKSSFWKTSPLFCPPGSPEFVNAMVGFAPRPDETPETLLKKLQVLETEFGRTPKKIPNEPRRLDLDLIAFGQKTKRTAVLTLPHPRAHLRKFVLQPLSEIAPGLILPGQEHTVAYLLEHLHTAEIVTRL